MKPAKATRHSALVLFGVFIALIAGFAGVQSAASKPSVSAPTITSKPADPSPSTSAAFAFSGPNGVTYKCGLDGSALTACASPKSYTALAQGPHTFRVVATQGGTDSAEVAYSWRVDTIAPPPPTFSSGPSGLVNSTTATFSFSDVEAGVAFRCAIDAKTPVACTSPVTYASLSQGVHTIAVSAVDAAGNASAPTTRSWSVDSVAPPAPAITTKPTDPTSNATNTFAWTTAESGVAFQCSLENGAWASCTTPYTWVIDTTNNQQHQLAVRSVDSAGNVSPGTYYTFKYQKGLPDSGVPFTISGGTSGLTLGLWRTINVTITNPNNVTIFVSSLTVSIAADSTPAGCLTAPNVELEQSNVSGSVIVTVPPNGSLTLPAQGATNPRIRLKNLPTVNQDVCKGKSFTLSYAGTANN